MSENGATVWMLAYFRQVYGGRVEVSATGETYVVPLTDVEIRSEFLHLAWSRDGLHWTPLNGNQPILPNPQNTRVTRDPFVRRGPDGVFHLLATGGLAPTDIFYARSTNLINWDDQRAVPLAAHLDRAVNAWAPEWVWDEARNEFFVFWSSSFGQHGWDDSRIWHCRTPDFRTFSAPRLLFDPGYTVIDATLVPFDGLWYMIYKDERFGAIHGEHRFLKVATAPTLDGPYTPRTENVTPSLIEGPAVFWADGRWLMVYDWCMADNYGASESSDLLTWQPIEDVSFPAHARHGSVFAVTETELAHLRQRLGDSEPLG